MRARWRCLVLCLCAAMLPLFALPVAGCEQEPALRALLISCDRFVTMPETTPSSYNNVVGLRRALLEDGRGYHAMRAVADRTLDAGEFARLARETLGEAREGDISLIYFSSHGLLTPQEGRVNFALLFSDGERETLLDSRAIYEGLKDIRGLKVLILDACFSGAAIHKGDEGLAVASLFSGPDFKVLTSAGAREPSFLWTDPQGTLRGGSYFAQALVKGISARGGFAADSNRDGTVTLAELLRHQRLYYGASSPQLYPEGDPLPVFTYDRAQPAEIPGAVSDLSIENPLLGPGEEEIAFSYTLNQPARVAYQLIYERQNSWRFDAPQSIAEPGGEGGLIAPGRKEARLRLAQEGPPLSGYLLMLMITVEDRACPGLSHSGGAPGGDRPVAPLAALKRGQAALVRHEGPCLLTAEIHDEEAGTSSPCWRTGPAPCTWSPRAAPFTGTGLTRRETPPGPAAIICMSRRASERRFTPLRAPACGCAEGKDGNDDKAKPGGCFCHSGGGAVRAQYPAVKAAAPAGGRKDDGGAFVCGRRHRHDGAGGRAKRA